MKKLPEKLLKMIENGYYQRPEAMIKVDIEPPFVGADFEPSGCDPSFHEYKDVLYLVFIDNGKIKIAVVDPVEMMVTSLIREIDAPNARRPRLIFEPSTHPGREDLPHIGYTDLVAEKAMVYREQYDEEGNIVRIFDEIGTGGSTESVRKGDMIIDFYVSNDGVVYCRYQGNYAEPVITPTPEEKVKSLRVVDFPDSRLGLVYILQTNEGADQVRFAWSEILGQMKLEEPGGLTAVVEILAIDMPKTVYHFAGEEMDFTLMTVAELVATLYSFDESMVFTSEMMKADFPPQFNFDGEEMDFALNFSQVVFVNPFEFSEEMKFTLSMQVVELYI